MPQASDEDRNLMQEYFGDPISDSGPMNHLLERGYHEERGMWTNPNNLVPTQKDIDCLNFLVDEWDYAYDIKGEASNVPT